MSARAAIWPTPWRSGTHQDLQGRVAVGKFRADLLFRLNVIPVVVPPLRERTGDVRLLGQSFLARHAACRKVPAPTLQEASWRFLDVYAWPGNVRELQNVIERLVVLRPGAEIRAALDRHRGNKTRAAAELGIARSHLLRRMKALGLSGE